MSGQIDAGWAGAPFGIKQLDAGQIRVVMKAGDAPEVDKQTVRVIIANADALHAKPDLFARYIAGYRDTVDWIFSGVPHRFPELKIVMAEGGIGWVPMLQDRLRYFSRHDADHGAAVRPAGHQPTAEHVRERRAIRQLHQPFQHHGTARDVHAVGV